MFEEEKTFEARRPDFSSRDGVSVWSNQDKNGREYLSVRIPLLKIKVNCFKTEEADAGEKKESD